MRREREWEGRGRRRGEEKGEAERRGGRGEREEEGEDGGAVGYSLGGVRDALGQFLGYKIRDPCIVSVSTHIFLVAVTYRCIVCHHVPLCPWKEEGIEEDFFCRNSSTC